MGPGSLESAYTACWAYESSAQGHQVEREKQIPVVYQKTRIDCGFRADMDVDDVVIVELQAKDKLHPIDFAQTLSHLRLTDLHVVC